MILFLQNAIALLTQHMSYGTIFDRLDLGLRKELVDIQYMTAMNPTAGSFVICERAQRHFATFASLMPSKQDLTTIFKSLMYGHVMGFSQQVMDSCDRIVEASLVLYEDVAKKFLPSAVKFTYNWSLRELTNIFQGICLMRREEYNTFADVVKIWIHEFARVISDRFFTTPELDVYEGLLREVMKKQLNIANQDDYLNQCIIYTAFASSATGAYLPAASVEALKKVKKVNIAIRLSIQL